MTSAGTAPAAGRKRRAAPFKLTQPRVAEHPLQRQIADVLRLELAPAGKVSEAGVVWWAVDMANYAGVAATRVGRGCIAGVQDFYILYRGQAHHPELKTDDGRLSDEQKWLNAAVLCAGGKVGVVRNASEMIQHLDAWGVPRSRRVKI